MKTFIRIHFPNYRKTFFDFGSAAVMTCFILFHMLAVLPHGGFGQSNASVVHGIASLWKENQQQHYPEAISVIFDRPLYLSGEEAWFSLRCVDAVSGGMSHLSKIAYIEVFNPESKPVYQGMIGLEDGVGSASFTLPLAAASGFYAVRAYTAWMKNQTPDQWYRGYITVVNPFRNPGLPERSTRWNLKAAPEYGKLVAGLPNRLAYWISGSDTLSSKRFLHLGNDHGDTLVTRELYSPEQGFIEFTPNPNRSYRLWISGDGHIHGQVELGEIHDSGALVRPVPGAGDTRTYQIEAAGVSYPIQLILHRNGVMLWHKVLNRDEANRPVHLPEYADLPGRLRLLVLDSAGAIAGEKTLLSEIKALNSIEVKADRQRYNPGEEVRLSINVNEAIGTRAEFKATISVYRWSKSLDKQQLLEQWIQSGPDHPAGENSGAYIQAEPYPERELHALFNNTPTTSEQLASWARPAKLWLPEIRGPVVSGRVFDRQSMQPAQYATVFLSKTGLDWQFYVARSDTSGIARFEISGFSGERQLIMQPGPDSIRSLVTEAEWPFSKLPPDLVNMPFDLDESLADYLRDINISMQIRHNFQEHFPNQFNRIPLDTIPFYGMPDERYYLGNYTRFPVMEEVMREYVRGVLVRRRRGSFYFRLLDSENQDVFRRDPLVLLDGIPVGRTDAIMEYDPLRINRIDVITRKYVIGHKVAHGLVSYSSYHGDHPGFSFGEDLVVLPYPGIETPRLPWQPSAEQREKSRIPDFRNLLYWNPDLKVSPLKDESIEFRASDQTGVYRIEVHATGPDGRLISGYSTLAVGDDVNP